MNNNILYYQYVYFPEPTLWLWLSRFNCSSLSTIWCGVCSGIVREVGRNASNPASSASSSTHFARFCVCPRDWVLCFDENTKCIVYIHAVRPTPIHPCARFIYVYTPPFLLVFSAMMVWRWLPVWPITFL